MEEDPKVLNLVSSCSTSLPILPRLWVLVVDGDSASLKLIDNILHYYNYAVTATKSGMTALEMLKDENYSFDIVLIDVHLPDMDGLILLEKVVHHIGLPVVLLSTSTEPSVALRGLELGACFYITKPPSANELKNIWQHVIQRRGKIELREVEETGSVGYNTNVANDEGGEVPKPVEDAECSSSTNEDSWKETQIEMENYSGKENKEEEDEEETKGSDEVSNRNKRPRMIWHSALHDKFVRAVHYLGFEGAVPKKILEIMDSPGLTRENVASHLQTKNQLSTSNSQPKWEINEKYRLYLRKMWEADQSQQPNPFNTASSNPGFSLLLNTQSAFTSATPMGFLTQQNQMNCNNFGMQHTHNQPIQLEPQFAQQIISSSILQQGNTSTSNARIPHFISTSSSPADISNIDHHHQVFNQPQHQMTEKLYGTGAYGASNDLVNTNGLDELSIMEGVGGSQHAGFSPLLPQFGSNYIGLKMTSTGELLGVNLSGPICESSGDRNSSFNLMNNTNYRGKMPVENAPAAPNYEFSSLECTSDGMVPFNMDASTSICLRDFNGMIIQQQNDLVSCGTSKDLLLEMRKSSTPENLTTPTHFTEPDLEEFVFRQAQEGAGRDLDLAEFHLLLNNPSFHQ